MNVASVWRTIPRRSMVIFLLAVFFVFANIGFANDIMDMGRQTPLHFALASILPGLFAIAYAYTGVLLRSRFWKACLPIFVVQVVVMGMLAHWLPDPPQPAQTGPAQLALLQSRLTFDGIATIVAVSLGYTGFIYVFISEGRRFLKARTAMATLEGEMAAAREVQRVMVPDHPPLIHGYTIESVYRPAAEVGGDFFQVIPLASGRALVVIGDVSGKGLRAAMIVSMIVGALRTVSSFTEEPAEILAELNRRLCGHMQEGFATCLAVRLEAQGQLTLANAGHLPPYLNGTEVAFNGSLPLGLDESATWQQTTLQMSPSDTVVLLTDGVAEAQNELRVLFGFARVESMLGRGATASSLAQSAQLHGQNDDLTVLRLARVA